MKGFKTLTLKRIQKRHKENPQDKELHEKIEKGTVDKKELKRLIDESAKTEPFDKK